MKNDNHVLYRDGIPQHCAPWVKELSEHAQEELYRPLWWTWRKHGSGAKDKDRRAYSAGSDTP